MTWTWLGIVVALFLLLSFVIGYRRGFIKEIVSAFFVLLAIAVVWFINPYVNTFVKNQTPLYINVQDTCSAFVNEQLAEISTPNQNEQQNVIEELALPEFLKNEIAKNNTADTYRNLAVNSFAEYISEYLAVAAVNGVSFLISFILATLMIRILTYALNIIAHLPVLNGINKILGALTGLIKGVVFVWIAFLVMTVLCNTGIGQKGMALIEQDTLLNYLYNQNILVQIFMSVFNGNIF